jgi:hypothetical protein
MPFSNAPWSSVSESDYSSAEEYCSACLIDENPSGEKKTKDRCHLPVRMPRDRGGAYNTNALTAVAAVLAGARGGVKASAASKAAAARKLRRLYSEAKMNPPPSLRRMG